MSLRQRRRELPDPRSDERMAAHIRQISNGDEGDGQTLDALEDIDAMRVSGGKCRRLGVDKSESLGQGALTMRRWKTRILVENLLGAW